jgi:hypothetical protein
MAFSETAPGMKFDSLDKLFNTYPYVLQAAEKWRGYRKGHATER